MIGFPKRSRKPIGKRLLEDRRNCLTVLIGTSNNLKGRRRERRMTQATHN